MAKGKGGSRVAKVLDGEAAERGQPALREQFLAAGLENGLTTADQAAASDVGLRLPHLCLRMLFQRTTFPLERVMIIFGPTGANKSTLLYYFYDLFRRNQGMYFHIEVESKDTPTMRLAVTEYDKEAGWGKEAQTMDDFQEMVSYYLDWFKGQCASKAAKKNKTRHTPLVVGIDSLVAKLTKEAQTVFEKHKGVATRRFADEARSLSDWFKFCPQLIQGWPFSLIAINHDKPKPSDRPGMVLHSSPGGSAPNYYSTYRLLCQKVQTLKLNSKGYAGNRIKISTEKNSLGPDKVAITAEVRWGSRLARTPDGTVISAQHTYWDWDRATTELLADYAADAKRYGYWKKQVDSVLGLRKVSGGRYACRALDIGGESALTAPAMGRAIEARRDLLDELEPLLGIQTATAWQPGLDFEDQLKTAVKNCGMFVPSNFMDEAMAEDSEAEDDPAPQPEE
jgi:hypothetical protein